jgi:putative cardiolipin synthase
VTKRRLRIGTTFAPGLRRVALLALLVPLVLCAAGCATLAELPPPRPVLALAASDSTSLGRLARAAQPDPELSGFRLLPGGDFALHARLALARRAEQSLDLPYYQIGNDEVGRTVLLALRDAAARGVRVRLLVDDLYTSGADELLLGLAATANVEVRLFNPFAAGRTSLVRRYAASLLDFARVNRRMHNKLFIADGALAVAGGRNLANEYFALDRHDDNFVDIDALVAGALVARLAALFDAYWNSPYVRPIASVATTRLAPPELAARFAQQTGAKATPLPRPPPPNDVLGYAPIGEDLEAGRIGLIWAPAEAWADSPERVVGKVTNYGGVPLLDVDSVRYNVIEQIRRARSEVSIVSPYLIPGAAGLDEIRSLRRRGVRIGIVTNSLASTDEPLVYAAYRRYRPELLRAGVEIWELGSARSSSSVRRGLLGSRIGRLHAKTAVVDRRIVFIGSMNFDPRSARSNTELGLIVHSDELARQVLKLTDTLKQQGAWRLRSVAAGDRVEWVSGAPGDERVLDADPDTTFCDRAVPAFLAPFVPESLL